ncbi:MAG: ABC transporter substrate-binding protein/permease [Dissulfurispiraceae bacterium]|jgi:polar amino acid transport system substrate-binding protein|nr:ABC transporter substrate-binding protein/permease [Dissulfurispiraceae bacterium]
MNRKISALLFAVVAVLALYLVTGGRQHTDALSLIKERGYLLWGADAEGGAPYIFPDPVNPSKMMGFEVDIADAIARELGVRAKHIQNAWDSLIPALERGDTDIAMNGIEITEQRESRIIFTAPYYIYSEQLVVRSDDMSTHNLQDLKGKKAGTLSGTAAQTILEKETGIIVKIYPGQVEPYEDLALGRINGVLLDLPIAAYYAKPNPKLRYAGDPIGRGYYGIAVRKNNPEFKKELDRILLKLYNNGELARIYEKWDMWNADQADLLKIMGEKASAAASLKESKEAPLYTFIPTLLKGAGVTVFISVVSMILAVGLGLFLALMKMYGRGSVRILATAYIEFYRGTPLLIQLFILYYGLPNIGISLSPLAAAFIGLGMNYAAYEAEVYRAGINAVPKGQMEAAMSLGMSSNVAIRRILLPQALRVSLPAITNDFIALFKDSSLVSIIAMVELAKTYSILAATTLRFFELGIIVALLYFVMSYPMSLLASRLEERLKGHK